MEKFLPPPPTLDVKCWTAGLHQQRLVRPGGLHLSSCPQRRQDEHWQQNIIRPATGISLNWCGGGLVIAENPYQNRGLKNTKI